MYETILNLEGKNFGQQLYDYCHGRKQCGCGVDLSFINVVEGYRGFCKACYEEDRKHKPETRPAPICNNYGCNNIVTGKNAYDGKWKLHCSLKCRGIDNSVRSRDKSEETQMAKYGVKHHRMTQESKDKLKNSMLNKYGVENAFQMDTVKEKNKSIMMDRYGVENPAQAQEVKNKMKNTCLERYGVENPSQNYEIHQKKLRNQKQHTLPNGDIIDIQGYEPNFLDIVKNHHPLTNDIINVPTITYRTDKVYFPDFYFKEYNLVIEIKSVYTITVDKRMVYDKVVATVESGYGILLVVMDEKNILSLMYYNADVLRYMDELGYDDTWVLYGKSLAQYTSGLGAVCFSHDYFTYDRLGGVNDDVIHQEMLEYGFDYTNFKDVPQVTEA